MVDGIGILDWPLAPRQSGTIAGWRGTEAVCHTDVLERIGQWKQLLLGTTGHRFAAYFSDSIEFAAALFGAWQAGKTVYLPSDTLPATCSCLQQTVDGFVGDFPSHCAPLLLPEEAPAFDASSNGWEVLDPEFVGLVVFTSGSTGEPQAIPKKLRQLATEVATLEQLFGGLAGDARIVATVSHQHIYGLLFKVLWPLAFARPIHARSLSYPEELVEVTASHDCMLVSSPAHLKRLPDSPIWISAAHRIRAVFSSGGPLPLEVVQITAKLLDRVPVEVYGSSETGGIAWRQRNADADESWLLMPGVDVDIDSADNALSIRSPHLPDATWFRTSDRAQLLDHRRFNLLGRADRIVKIEEKRISLDLIESRLKQSSLVREARVIVVPGRRQRIAAFVVLSDDGQRELCTKDKHALNSRLREWLADVVERIALPRSWRYLDALPVNAQGKTTQAELMSLLDDTASAGPVTLPQKKLLTKDALHAAFELIAPHDLVYFDGHFPQAPILPGVAQVDWALQLARECFELPASFRGIHALKFQQVIRPDTAFSLELSHDPAKNSVAFKYFSSMGVHASGRLMFGAADV